MKATVITPLFDDHLSTDFGVIVKSGWFTLEEASKFAGEYGDGYAGYRCVAKDGGFLANFANSDEAEVGEDGLYHPDYAGDLTLDFQLTEIT